MGRVQYVTRHLYQVFQYVGKLEEGLIRRVNVWRAMARLRIVSFCGVRGGSNAFTNF